jgi:hypothetical protein
MLSFAWTVYMSYLIIFFGGMTFPDRFRFACLVRECAAKFDFFFNIMVAEGNLEKQLLYIP